MPCGPRSHAGWRRVAETAASRHPGLILGIARFYHDPRGSTRAMLASAPGEARLLAYAVIAATVLLAGRVVTLIAGAAPGDDLAARLTEQVVSLIFFLPLVYYGLAAAGTWVARSFGGAGRWFEGRAAFFWGALVSAPVMLLAALAALALAASPRAAAIVSQAGAVFFAWALAQTYAETFGFRNALKVLAVIAGLSFAIASIAWAIAQA